MCILWSYRALNQIHLSRKSLVLSNTKLEDAADELPKIFPFLLRHKCFAHPASH